MKKILSLVLCCITAISFSSCVTIPTPLDICFEAEEITSIEVYYFDEPIYWDSETKGWIYKNWEEEYKETPYTGEPIAYVEEADYEQFISDVEELPFKVTTLLIPAPFDPIRHYGGYVVKINCQDEYELVANYGGGNRRDCSDEDWQEFLKKYIGEEHFQFTQEE